ncbi:MAG: hypothetical protein WC775_02485 [Patescibacteria group bacterium]
MGIQHLLRIKVNDFNLVKIILINGQDFNISLPKTNVANKKVDVHFSLHTVNDRLTFKTVSIHKNGKEVIEEVIIKAQNNPQNQYMAIPGKKELDLFKGKDFNLQNPTLLMKTPIGIGVNLVNSSIDKLFVNKKTKTPDSLFTNIENILIPNQATGISIQCFIGKNFIGKLQGYTDGYDKWFNFEEHNYLGNTYLFLFAVKFKFPEVKSSPSAIQV